MSNANGASDGDTFSTFIFNPYDARKKPDQGKDKEGNKEKNLSVAAFNK